MEIKKSPKANLENKKLLFTEIGLILSLLVVWLAFEWSTTDKQVSVFEETAEVVEAEEMIPITQETPPPPPTAAPKIPILSDQIDIVDDEIQVDDNLFMNLEDDASMGVEIMDSCLLPVQFHRTVGMDRRQLPAQHRKIIMLQKGVLGG